MRETITDSIQFWISVVHSISFWSWVQYIFFRKHTLQSKITSKHFHFITISTIVILLKFSFDGTIMNVYIDSNVDLFKIKKTFTICISHWLFLLSIFLYWNWKAYYFCNKTFRWSLNGIWLSRPILFLCVNFFADIWVMIVIFETVNTWERGWTTLQFLVFCKKNEIYKISSA